MAKTIESLIEDVNDRGYEGILEGIEKIADFVEGKQEFNVQDLYSQVQPDLDEYPSYYLDALPLLELVTEKVTSIGDGEDLELTYQEGLVMGLYLATHIINDVNDDPIALRVIGFAGAIRQTIDDMEEARESLVG